MSRSRIVKVLVVTGIALSLLACGGAGGAARSTTQPEPTAPPTARPLMSFDFEPVCRRGKVAGAAAYEPTLGQVHPILVFKRDSPEDNNYYEMFPSTLELPVPWMVDYQGDYTTIELVACLTRTGGDLMGTCDYKDDDSDKTYLLDVYNSTYEMKIYAARTGEEVGTATLEATLDDCPMLHMFSEEKEDYFAWPSSGVLESTLRPYVEP